MKGFELFKEEEPDITPLTPDEIKLIKSACQKKARPLEQTRLDMTIFLIDTGSRLEDVQNFKVKSVDLTGQIISYIQLKTGKKRTIHLEHTLLTILTRRIKNKNPDDFVFTNRVGGIMHQPDYHQWLKNFCKNLGMIKRVSPHVFRHSYAQNSYDKTGDIYLTKDLIGHRNIRSTMRYAHNSLERLKKAQQSHPHVASEVKPEVTIKNIKHDLDSYLLEEDKRFNTKLIRQTFNLFIEGLYNAINLS